MFVKKRRKRNYNKRLAGILIISMCLCAVPVQAEEIRLEDPAIDKSERGVQEKKENDSLNVSVDKIHITDKEKREYFYITFLQKEYLDTEPEMNVEDESIVEVKKVKVEEITDYEISEEVPDDAYWYRVDWKSNGQTNIQLKWKNIKKEIIVISESYNKAESLDSIALVSPGWLEEADEKYYINVDGTKAKGFALIDGILYYFDEDTGVLHQKAGWINKGDEQYFCNDNGEVYRNMFIYFGDICYYMGDDGSLQRGIIEVDGNLYYADDKSGVVKRTSGWIHREDGTDYFAAEDGILYRDRFISFGNTYYYMGNDGSVQKGLFQIEDDLYYSDLQSGIAHVTEGWIEYDNKSYYSQSGGKLYVGQFAEIQEKNYCFAEDGSLYKGTFTFQGNKYHSNSVTGEVKFESGWIEDGDKLYFANEEGIIYYNQFIRFGSIEYYMGEDGSMQKGVIEVDNTLYYADEKSGIIQKSSGWIHYNNKRYFANEEGILYRNQMIAFGNTWYYLGIDGSVQTGIIETMDGILYYAVVGTGIIQKNSGWIEYDEKRYFAKEGGVLYQNSMISFGKIRYYMGTDGSVQKGIIETVNGVYYADLESGIIQDKEEGWFEDNQGKKYFVGPDGKFYSNQLISFGNTQYYMGSDGSVQKGIVKTVNDILYYADSQTGVIQKKAGWITYKNHRYFSDANGQLYHNQFISFGNTQYYMGSDGSVQKGIVKTVNDILYYADSQTGVIQKKAGWITYKNHRYFSDVNGQLYYNQLISFGNTWYYMGADGSVQKGILEIKGDLYYASISDGKIKRDAGWVEYNGKKYFANEQGILYRNQFITFGLDTYYLDSDGSMVKGRKCINGIWYTFDEETGLLERKTGWFTSGNKKYYIKENGSLAKGYTDIDGVRYYFDSTGALASKMGIDVSQWQGNINWSEVKKAGVEFAMIRVGYRGSAAAGKLMADPYYKQNIEGALAAGIKVGVYFFSQAINVQEAKEEAQFTYNLIKDYNITYPVAFDSEYYNSDRDGRADYLSATQRTLMANTFCIEMQRLGYKPMVYASTSFFQTDLQLSMLTKWQLWVAQYNTVITHKGSYQCWQYTSTGKVNGISGNVDMNVWIN